MIEQILALLQGPSQIILLIYFFCLDISALNFMMRIILMNLVPLTERTTLIDSDQRREIMDIAKLDAFQFLVYVAAHAAILYWAFLHLPVNLFILITLIIVFLCYIFFGAPVIMVVLFAYKQRIKNIDLADTEKLSRMKIEMLQALKGLAYVVKVTSYLLMVIGVALFFIHIKFHDQLINIR